MKDRKQNKLDVEIELINLITNAKTYTEVCALTDACLNINQSLPAASKVCKMLIEKRISFPHTLPLLSLEYGFLSSDPVKNVLCEDQLKRFKDEICVRAHLKINDFATAKTYCRQFGYKEEIISDMIIMASNANEAIEARLAAEETKNPSLINRAHAAQKEFQRLQ